ncbi:aminobenzoyl-glutamate utilization protein A [Scopulibacillus darangshiensis]|uniref:Aminobenzoyl-glutamate utilization protein A n=1 Tax=Scopulibacillus darangshiensis TaxID=442528 RepID=A0A4R2P6L2_9BACL|nr:amidohydrolase [Scopulibacillus darangshiensis]TCP29435.1 aminobenzoyl-glutamate utilization protein A [Scopulibacillus darangshiensis]
MIDHISKLTEKIYPTLIEWRRDFHKHAESGWAEFRTASIVASKLSSWGYDVRTGMDVIDTDARMGVPDKEFLEQQEKRALSQGADPEWLRHFSGGFTGVVAILDTGQPGPTIGFRVDMDALDIQESSSKDHLPAREGFASMNTNMMHACGHDAHTSIGLGVAYVLSQIKSRLKGRIKLIFQPAEEGVRGAKSMVEKGVVDDVDLFIATHIGLDADLGELICGNLGHLATTKFDVTYTGKSAHAGANPEDGKNALLAAAAAALNMHAISRHSEGQSRVNVGVLHAGSGRNIIPGQAHLKAETRGTTTEINQHMYQKAVKIVKAAASMYEIDASIDIVGGAESCEPSEELLGFIRQQADNITEIHSVKATTGSPGSEDATYMMSRVQEKGGLSAYIVFGTKLAAGHHNERFDFDEQVMSIAVKTLTLCACHADKA